MARAEMSSSGTKYSFVSNRRPTSVHGGTMNSFTSFRDRFPRRALVELPELRSWHLR